MKNSVKKFFSKKITYCCFPGITCVHLSGYSPLSLFACCLQIQGFLKGQIQVTSGTTSLTPKSLFFYYYFFKYWDLLFLRLNSEQGLPHKIVPTLLSCQICIKSYGRLEHHSVFKQAPVLAAIATDKGNKSTSLQS